MFSRFRMHNGQQQRGFRALAVLCLLLVALLVLVQVAHTHPFDTDNDATHCPLCILMQSAAPVLATATAILLVALGLQAPQRPQLLLVHPRTFYLFTRPPPPSRKRVPCRFC